MSDTCIKVMNNDDLRREIFKYLRKKPKISCFECMKVLVWDKKVRDSFIKLEKNNKIYYNCNNCFNNKMKFLTWSDT